MYAQKRVFNPQVFLELICYVTFAILMFYLLITGKYQSYVTPKMVPYFYFTMAVMIVWTIGGVFRLFRPQGKTRAAHCLVLAIPIVLLLLPHSPINTSNLSASYLSGNVLAGLDGGIPSDNSNIGNTESSLDNAGISSKTPAPNAADASESVHQLPGLDTENKKITVSNDDFGRWLSELYANSAKYKGYTLIMTGFVLKDAEGMQNHEFVPARLMMSCCVADLAPAGLLCNYDSASELKADSWVTVEGTLMIGKYKYGNQEFDDPQISVTKITPAEKVEGYVYP